MLLEERLEAEIKNTLFEYSYLNEKIVKTNLKCKNVLYPSLQKKQIMSEVLQNLWKTYAKHAKIDLDVRTEKLK